MLETGIKAIGEIIVNDALTAKRFGSGELEVLFRTLIENHIKIGLTTCGESSVGLLVQTPCLAYGRRSARTVFEPRLCTSADAQYHGIGTERFPPLYLFPILTL